MRKNKDENYKRNNSWSYHYFIIVEIFTVNHIKRQKILIKVEKRHIIEPMNNDR